MFQKYTDIAMELHEMSLQGGFDDGIKISKTDFAGVEVSVADVPSGANKPKGVYYTLDVGRVWEQSLKLRRQRSEAIAGVIKLMTRGAGDEVLIVGIGNRNITPDSVGPLTADGVIATRHIRSQRPELYHSMGCGNVAVIAPGVMGQTGIGIGEVVRGIVKSLRPSLVVAVDALAARRLSRLCTTVQISDAGIAPGSGVGNSRGEISYQTLGVPVVAIGMPTVVDAATLAADLTGELHIDDRALLDALKYGSGNGLFVSPKDSDVIIRDASRIIADGINLAFHKNIPYEEINEYR